MEPFLAQIAALLTAPPGNLVYHLVLAFCVAGALSTSLFQAPPKPNRPIQRLQLGLSVLLALQVALFLTNCLAWQRGTSLQAVLPAVDRAASALCLLILIWLWIAPFYLKHEKTWAVLAAGCAVLFCLATLAAAPAPRRMPFNLVWTDGAWQAGMLLLSILGMWISARRRLPAWGLGAGMLALIGLGRLTQLLFRLPDGDFPGLARLAEIVAYPFLFALPGRPLFSSQAETRPNPFAQNRRRHSTDPATLKAFFELASQAHSAPGPAAISRAIAHALIADCCYLVAPYDPSGQLTLLGGYDLIQDAALSGFTIDGLKVPSLAAALRQGQTLLETGSPGSPNPANQVLASAAHLARAGNLFFFPFGSSSADPQGGLLLLSPYSNREWTAEDQVYLSKTTASIAQLAHPTVTAPAVIEEDSAAPVAPGVDPLQEVLDVQQALQETIERLQEENAALRSAAIANGFNPAGISRPGSVPVSDEIGMRQPMPEGEFLKLVGTILFQMRQAITTSAGFSELLDSQPRPTQPEEIPLSSRLRHAIEKARFLLEGLSRLVSLQSSPETLAADWISLPELIDQGLGFIRAQMAQKGLALRLGIPADLPALQTDEMALRQILTHLLQNAATVSPPRGAVTVCAHLQAEESLSPILVLQVTDTGGGIPARDLYRVFSLPSGDRETTIRGVSDERMGLQVAHSLVQALGGRIWIEAGEDGSTFSILLPVTCAAPTPARLGP